MSPVADLGALTVFLALTTGSNLMVSYCKIRTSLPAGILWPEDHIFLESAGDRDRVDKWVLGDQKCQRFNATRIMFNQ